MTSHYVVIGASAAALFGLLGALFIESFRETMIDRRSYASQPSADCSATIFLLSFRTLANSLMLASAFLQMAPNLHLL